MRCVGVCPVFASMYTSLLLGGTHSHGGVTRPTGRLDHCESVCSFRQELRW